MTERRLQVRGAKRKRNFTVSKKSKIDPEQRAAFSMYTTPTLSMVAPLLTGAARPLTKEEIAKQQADAKAALAKKALPTLSLATPKLAAGLTATQEKPKGGIVRELVAPMRGYKDEELKNAKPTLKETTLGGVKFGAEILGGAMTISNLLGEKTGINKLTGADSAKSKELTDKILTWAEPDTAGEASSMRVLDAVSMGFGGLLKSAAKSARLLSKVDDAARVTKELKALGLTPNPTLVTNIVKETNPDKILNIITSAQKAEAVALGAARSTAQSTIRTADGIRVPVGKNKARFAERAKTVAPTAPIKTISNTVRNTDKLAVKAKNLISDTADEAERIALSKRNDDKAIAIASELIKDLSRKVDLTPPGMSRNLLNEKIAEITQVTAKKLTALGRAVQAATILTRNTPEGMMRFLQKELDAYNASVGGVKGSLAGRFRKAPDLTMTEKKEIMERWRTIISMPDEKARAMASQKFFEDFNRRIPTTTLKKITTVWRAGLLTGIKTTGLNVASNLSHLTTEVLKDLPATLVDILASKVTGKRTKALTVRGIMRGLKEGKIKGKQYFSTGFDERNIGEKLDYNQVNFKHKAFQVYTDTVFRIMGVTDQPFYYAAYARSMFDQALAKGINEGLKGKELVKYAEELVKAPTDDMVRYGVMDATTVVFQQDSRFTKAVSDLQKLHPAMEFAIPFAKTPSNVAMQIINYSPLGILKPVNRIIANVQKNLKLNKLYKNRSAGKLSEKDALLIKQLEEQVFDQRQFSQELGRATTGTAFMALGYKLMEEGRVSLGFPRGDEKMQELNKAEGKKPNSILINGKWRSPMVLGPVGILILMGAHFKEALNTSGSPTEAYIKTIAGTWSSFLEQTFLLNVSTVVQAITDPERGLQAFAANLTSSFVPTLVSDVARAKDPNERIISTKDVGTNIKQRTMARIPGLREQLPKAVDVFGRTIERVGNPLEVLADPTRPSPNLPTPVTTEIRRLMRLSEQTGDEELANTLRGAMVTRPGTAGSKNGYDTLTQGQNRALWKYNGIKLNENLANVLKNPKYQKADDAKKARIIRAVALETLVATRAYFIKKDIKGLKGEERRKRLLEHKAAGMLTEDVARAMGF